MPAKYIIGDVRAVLAAMPKQSVDLVLTSPPFFNLRSYLSPDDENKTLEIGQESTPGEYVDTLLDIVDLCADVLAPHGSLVWELGDSYCVDEETEILTQRGWLNVDQLTTDDIALTLNPRTRLAEWQSVAAINRFPAAPRQMLQMESPRGHSSLTTANHRWLVESRTTTMGVGTSRPGEQNGFAVLKPAQIAEIRSRYAQGIQTQAKLAAEYGVTQTAISKVVTGRTWRNSPKPSDRSRSWLTRETCSARLATEDRIPVSAPISNLPTNPKWDDALVELVAWYWTEGNDRSAYGRARGLWIVQSGVVHPKYCDRIRQCLTRLFGTSVSRLLGRSQWAHHPDPPPQWREELCGDGMIAWKLNGAAADVIRQHAPDKVVRPEWLAQLTQAQLDLFVKTSLDADGHERRSEAALAQSNQKDMSVQARRRAEAFQIAAILSGRYATLRESERKIDGYVKAVHPRWSVYIGTKRYFKPARTESEWITFDGPIWCPTTANGSWLARRHGTPFFTGNSGSGGAGGDYNEDGLREGQNKFVGTSRRERNRSRDTRPGREGTATAWTPRPEQRGGPGYPLDRSLCLIPEIFRFSLVYGFNPLTGRQTPKWRARNVIRWCRPNPPVGALGDKFRPATSEMVVVCKDRRYFDLDAVRTEPLTGDRVMRQTTPTFDPERTRHLPNHGERLQSNNPAGVPPLDWWNIPTQSYSGSHYACWPEKLCEIPIESMCPRRVCLECGKPSTRIVERDSKGYGTYQIEANGVGMHRRPGREIPNNSERTTIGWSDCGHNAWRPGITLDPFAGSGTTLQVATGHGRDAIGIDLDPRNAALAIERVGGLFLEVEHFSNEDLTPAQ